MPRDPYGPRAKPTPIKQSAVVEPKASNDAPEPTEPGHDDETKQRCPTCRGCGHITALEGAALEEDAKRRERCICQ